MKKVITAIGDKTLNSVLRNMENITIENNDIQYQEGIIEALEKYQDIDIIILSQAIIGSYEIEDLLRMIVMLRKDINIILIVDNIFENVENKNVIKVIEEKENYVNEVVRYLSDRFDITKKKVTKIIQKEEILSVGRQKEKLPNLVPRECRKEVFREKKFSNSGKKQVITIIGAAGCRKNNIYCYII